MILTLTLLSYLLISLAGTYVSLTYYNKEYVYRSQSHAIGPIMICSLFTIIFSILYIKHIIVSYFIFWFIFESFTGIISAIVDRNKTSIMQTPLRSIINVASGLISCIGVLYILI